MKPTLQLLLMAAVTAGFAEAQNSDLGLLLGASLTSTSVSTNGTSGSPARVSTTNVSGGGQINYAFQVKETVAGRLYVELPAIFTGGVRSSVFPGMVVSSVGTTIFLTPGVRWKFTPASRVSVYAAAGGGIASFDGVFASVVSNSRAVTKVGRTTAGAFGFGLGLDFRLTRLVSLRGEYRDAITRGNIDGARHHSLFMFGAGLHF